MDYYHLTKPGIIYGNVMTTAAGFLFASRLPIDWTLLLLTLVGFALVTGSACAINNVIDREIDAKMERTKNRAIPSGRISVRNAILFGAAIGIIGAAIIFFSTNLVTLGVLLFGYCMYLIVYSIAKRRTVYFTYPGALAGAVPPVVGYTAVTGVLDTSAFLLYAILISWQMSHFYAISLFRAKEYAAAGIPVMSLQKGIVRTKIEIAAFIGATAVAVYTLLVPVLPLMGFAVVGAILLWFGYAIKGFSETENERWARHMFSYSLIILLAISFALALSAFL